MLAFQILTWIALGYLGGKLAARKGYNPTAGVIIGVLGGPLTWLVCLFLPKTALGIEQDALEREIATAPKIANCPNCGRQIPYGSSVCPECDYQIKKK